MAATTASGTEKTRAVMKELVGLALDGEYVQVDEIMREYGREGQSPDEWDRKCAEAVKNGAVLIDETVSTSQSIKYYDNEGRLHREDGPASENKDGHILWYVHGVQHRIGGPAWVYPGTGGTHGLYFHYGKMHREDGPAIVYASGEVKYYLKGRYLPTLPTKFGDVWDLKCLQAVIDGAEITKNGAIVYLKDGQKHNETGPAVKYHDGRSEVWIKGKCLSTTND